MTVDHVDPGHRRGIGRSAAMARIFTSTLRSKRTSLLAFALGMAFFHALIAVSFPAIGGLDAVNSVVQTFPDGLRTLLRIAPGLQAGFGVQDYLALSWFHPVFLGLGAAFVVNRAADALAQGVERGAVYLTLSRPIRRSDLVLGKAGELLLSVGIITVAGWLGLALGVAFTLDVALPLGRYLLVAGMAWLLFGALGSGALVISALCSRGGTAAGWGSAWTLIAFALDVIPAVANSPLGMLNPWHTYYPQEIVATGRVDPLGIAVLLGWVVGGLTTAAWAFGRRDLI